MEILASENTFGSAAELQPNLGSLDFPFEEEMTNIHEPLATRNQHFNQNSTSGDAGPSSSLGLLSSNPIDRFHLVTEFTSNPL